MPGAGDDLVERGAHVPTSHRATGDGVVQIAEAGALLEIVDDDGGNTEKGGGDLLF